jgi:hypothetical protein
MFFVSIFCFLKIEMLISMCISLFLHKTIYKMEILHIRDATIDLTKFQSVTIPTLHTYSYHGFFKPTI